MLITDEIMLIYCICQGIKIEKRKNFQLAFEFFKSRHIKIKVLKVDL